MQYTTFGSSSLSVSEIGFGAWGISGRDWGGSDDAAAKKAIHEAIEKGVTFIDTADVYGFGHSEELIAEVLKERGGKPDNLVIASKAGNNFYPFLGQEHITTPPNPDFSKKHIMYAAEQSLKRLGIDTLDILQLHSPDPSWLDMDEPWEALQQLKQEGKIRLAGWSIQSFQETAQAKYVDRYHEVLDALQVRYNMLEREAEQVLFPKVQQYGIGVIARIPMLFGLLTGKFTRQSRFGKDDHRQWNLSPEKLDNYLKQIEAHQDFFDKHSNYTMAQLALKFTVSHPACDVVIPGAKTPKQVGENVGAASVPLEYKDFPEMG